MSACPKKKSGFSQRFTLMESSVERSLESGVNQDAFHGIRTDQWFPGVRFGKFTGNAAFAPLWILAPQVNHALVERPARHIGAPTKSGDILSRLPGLKQKLALIGGGAWKVNVLSAHTLSIHPFGCRMRFKTRNERGISSRRWRIHGCFIHRCGANVSGTATT